MNMTIDEIFDYLKKHPEVLIKVDFPKFVEGNWVPINWVKKD